MRVALRRYVPQLPHAGPLFQWRLGNMVMLPVMLMDFCLG